LKKKIKIIDILCYISTGDYDKLPEKFEYAGYYWFWCLSCLTYETRNENNEETNLYDYLARNGNLNDFVEILDEEDEFEEFKSFICNVGAVNSTNVEDCIHTLFKQQTQLINNQKKIIERLKKEGK